MQVMKGLTCAIWYVTQVRGVIVGLQSVWRALSWQYCAIGLKSADFKGSIDKVSLPAFLFVLSSFMTVSALESGNALSFDALSVWILAENRTSKSVLYT